MNVRFPNSFALTALLCALLNVGCESPTSRPLQRPLILLTSSLPAGIIAAPYRATLAARGGTFPYSWTVTNLPPGLTADSAGSITGAPTAAGTFAVVVAVADDSAPPRSAQVSLTLVVSPSPLAICTSSLPSRAVGAAYMATLEAIGGTPPYVWATTGLPPGLAADIEGSITGIPTSAGTFTVAAVVADASLPIQSAHASLTLVISPPPLVITTSSLPPKAIDATYWVLLEATGGTPPYVWSATGIPPGLFVSNAGHLSGTPTAAGTYTVVVGVTDASVPIMNAQASLTLEVPKCDFPSYLSGAVLRAVANGDATVVAQSNTLLDAALLALGSETRRYKQDLAALFGWNPDGTPKPSSLTSIDWNPSRDAAVLRSTLGENAALLTANTNVNGSTNGPALALFGRKATVPYAIFASNPFRTERNEQMQQLLLNLMGRLTGGKAALRITIAELEESTYFRDESATRAWLTAALPDATFNAADLCDGSALAECLARTDLLILSNSKRAADDADQIVASIRGAMKRGVPVVYFHFDGGETELSQKLFAALDVTYVGDNYWQKYRLVGLDLGTVLEGMSPEQAKIAVLLEHLQSGQYDFALAEAPGHPKYVEQFKDGAEAVRNMMLAYDQSATDIFGTCGNYVPRLLALAGDRLRMDIRYPLKVEGPGTNLQTFLRAYYADHAVLNVRRVAPAQPDRGSFDPRDLSQVVATTRIVDLTSRAAFRSTGAYALPGRPMTVTRLDSGAGRVSVFVNTLRAGSTHEWEDTNYGGYARPKFLQSAHVPLTPGKPVVLTSVYGGPVQLEFDQNDVQVQVKFQNVGEHPYWTHPSDDAKFEAAIATNIYNWVEIATEGFEVHSAMLRYEATAKDPRWNTPAKLTAAIRRYTYDVTFRLAGYRGEGITEIPEIVDWANGLGLARPTLDKMIHGNFDQPLCGAGCSGNPYDAGWGFSPVGHGDIHELGHSLQSARFQLTHHNGTLSHANHSVTNWWAFYVANTWNDENPELPGASTWAVNHQSSFDALQRAFVEAPGERAGFSTVMDDFVAEKLAADAEGALEYNYTFFQQAMMVAKRRGVLENGWHLVARLHLLLRAFDGARASAAAWDAAKERLGFGDYSLDEASKISNNDFTAIALSYVNGLDFQDFFDMYGLAVGAKAKAQIQGFSFPVVERVFFALAPLSYQRGAMTSRAASFQEIPIDGATPWPATIP